MRELQRLDLSPYLRGLAVYAKNPVVALAPFAAALAAILLNQVLGGMLFIGLITYLVQGFGVGVAIIVADLAWRHGHASFAGAWSDAQRKAPDLFMATLGFGLVMFAADYIGNWVGPFGPILQALALGFLIYTLPAAAIGGVPGGAALQISVDRARANPGATIALAVIALAVYIGITVYAAGSIGAEIYLASSSVIAMMAATTVLNALALGYIATILAKVYSDISYGRRY